MNYLPEEDGITHINIYSKGKTELGRFASNFAYSPIQTVDGNFLSVEGYWYYLGVDESIVEREELRYLYGWKAKERGRELKNRKSCSLDVFKERIKEAIRIKFNNNPTKLNELKNSTLPFVHYYVYGGKLKEAGFEWIVEFFEEFRKEIKNE